MALYHFSVRHVSRGKGQKLILPGVQKKKGRKVYFDGNQDAKEVFAEVIAQKIRDTKTKDKLAIMKDKQYNDYEFSNLKSA